MNTHNQALFTGRFATRIVAVFAVAACVSLVATLSGCAKAAAQRASSAADVEREITWFGQSSIRIQSGGKTIYVDPLFFDKADKADIILITHTHGDHYSFRNVQVLSKKGTVVVAPVDLGFANRVMKPGTKTTIDGFEIEAVPAYNVVKTVNHPKADGNNGYVINVEGVRVYHAGDTELIPEMKDIACDIALLPLGQTYTFGSVDEAVNAALTVKAKIAIPIHYGLYEGSLADAHDFADKLRASGVIVDILEKRQ